MAAIVSSRQTFLPEVIPEVEYIRRIGISVSDILSFWLTLQRKYWRRNINFKIWPTLWAVYVIEDVMSVWNTHKQTNTQCENIITPLPWVIMTHVSDLPMIPIWSTTILTIIREELGQLMTHSPIYILKVMVGIAFILGTHYTAYAWQEFHFYNDFIQLCIKVTMRWRKVPKTQ